MLFSKNLPKQVTSGYDNNDDSSYAVKKNFFGKWTRPEIKRKRFPEFQRLRKKNFMEQQRKRPKNPKTTLRSRGFPH